MTVNYISTIRDGLKDFINKNNLKLSYSDSELEGIAWVGLQHTDEYECQTASNNTFDTRNQEAWKKIMKEIKDCK